MSNNTKPICTGAGLLALDVLFIDNDLLNPKIYAGGSMGNVQMILSFLGWRSFPIARLADDFAADEIKADLLRLGVETKLISTTSDGSTPVIIQRNYVDKKGNPKHKFQFRCPIKNEWFPGYKPIIRKSLEGIWDEHPQTNVFYFDKATRGNIDLAKFYKDNSALVFFEPSGISIERLFVEAIGIADILKFSSERIKNFDNYYSSSKAQLEIITQGEKGLIYRSKPHKKDKWEHVPGYKSGDVRDTSGAGDWFSASMINLLGVNAKNRLAALTIHDLEYYLRFSQAFAAINCQFNGARGAMYSLKKEEMELYANNVFDSGKSPLIIRDSSSNFIKDYEKLADLLIG